VPRRQDIEGNSGQVSPGVVAEAPVSDAEHDAELVFAGEFRLRQVLPPARNTCLVRVPEPVHTSPFAATLRTSKSACCRPFRDGYYLVAPAWPEGLAHAREPLEEFWVTIDERTGKRSGRVAAVDEYSDRDQPAEHRDGAHMVIVVVGDDGVLKGRGAARGELFDILCDPFARRAGSVGPGRRQLRTSTIRHRPASIRRVVPSGNMRNVALPRPVWIWWMSSVPGATAAGFRPAPGKAPPAQTTGPARH
jgi:hypothetical protein